MLKERGGSIEPIGCCTVYRNSARHAGILCCASIKMGAWKDEAAFIEHVKIKAGKNGYEDIRFADINDLNGLGKNYKELSEEDVQRNPLGVMGNKARKIAGRQVIGLPHFRNSIERAIARVLKGDSPQGGHR